MPVDYDSARIFRTLNVVVCGHFIVSNQLYIWRRKLTRNNLDWLLLWMSIFAWICIFMVAINISILPYTKTTPRTVFECNLFERSGNVTHFLMFVLMNAFLYIKVLSIFQSMSKHLGLSAVVRAAFHIGSLLSGFFFVFICVYIESFPLDNAEKCFFGTPVYTGHLISAAIIYCHVWFLAWFAWLLRACVKLGSATNLLDVVKRCVITTFIGTVMEVLMWEILSHFGALSTDPEIWNQILHMDMTVNVVLITANFADTKTRLTQFLFINFDKLDEHYVTSTSKAQPGTTTKGSVRGTATQNSMVRSAQQTRSAGGEV